MSGTREQRTGEVREAAYTVEQIRSGLRVGVIREECGVALSYRGLQTARRCNGRVVCMYDTGCVRVRIACEPCPEERRGRELVTPAAVIVIVAVEGDVQARQDEHQEDVQERRER